jgi:hypothetical protein
LTWIILTWFIKDISCRNGIGAEGCKTEYGNQSQISVLLLAEKAIGRHFSQQDA